MERRARRFVCLWDVNQRNAIRGGAVFQVLHQFFHLAVGFLQHEFAGRSFQLDEAFFALDGYPGDLLPVEDMFTDCCLYPHFLAAKLDFDAALFDPEEDQICEERERAGDHDAVSVREHRSQHDECRYDKQQGGLGTDQPWRTVLEEHQRFMSTVSWCAVTRQIFSPESIHRQEVIVCARFESSHSETRSLKYHKLDIDQAALIAMVQAGRWLLAPAN